MLKKILAVLTIISVIIIVFAGCKKKSPQAKPQSPPAETATGYQVGTEQEITEENMAAELDKIEKQLEQELSSEQ